MKLQTVKVRTSDIKRIEKMRLHKTEPRWSVIERALNALAK